MEVSTTGDPMPHPYYRKPNTTPINVFVADEIKQKLLNVCYTLNATEKDAIAIIIEDYCERHAIKERPKSVSKWRPK